MNNSKQMLIMSLVPRSMMMMMSTEREYRMEARWRKRARTRERERKKPKSFNFGVLIRWQINEMKWAAARGREKKLTHVHKKRRTNTSIHWKWTNKCLMIFLSWTMYNSIDINKKKKKKAPRNIVGYIHLSMDVFEVHSFFWLDFDFPLEAQRFRFRRRRAMVLQRAGVGKQHQQPPNNTNKKNFIWRN